MSRGKWAAAAAVVLILLGFGWYFASPVWTLSQMKSAAEANDADSFAAYIDFPALREDMKAELMVEMMAKAEREKGEGDQFAEVGLAFGTAMLGPMIDRMITPAALRAAFLARERRDGAGKAPLNVHLPENPLIERRGLSEFLVISKDQPGKGMVFKRHGLSWRLSGFDVLPEAVSSEAVNGNDIAARAAGEGGIVTNPSNIQTSEVSAPAYVAPATGVVFNQLYLVGAWVQVPGSCSDPDDQTVIRLDGMSDDETARYTVQSPARMVIGSDGEGSFAVSAVTPNSFISRDLDPTVPEADKVWRWRRCAGAPTGD